MPLGLPCPPFLNTQVFLKYLIIFQGLNPREQQWKCQPAKSIFSVSVLKGSVDKIQNNREEK